jgi:omega-amidase
MRGRGFGGPLRIALIQMDIAWEDRRANLRKAGAMLREAAALGPDVAVLPEMFSTGFSMDPAAAEDEDGETASFLSELSGGLGINLIAGFAARSSAGGRGRNIAAVYDREGRLLGTYAKVHLFRPAGEDLCRLPGEEAVTFLLDGVPSSVFICYDLRFPEAFRKVAGEAHALFVLANWPASRQAHWEVLLRARAIENQCFVIGVNRVGADGNSVAYAGGSRVYGPSGEEVCSAGDGELCLMAEIDPGEAARVRAVFPFLRDRRP